MKTVKSSSWGAKLMALGRTVLVATYIISFGTAIGPVSAQAETSTDTQPVSALQVTSSSILPSQVVAATNQMRLDVNDSTLAVNAKLTRSAQMKAEDMAKNSYFAHENALGQRLAYWLGVVGYQYQFAGENLAVGFDTTSAVMQGWKNSPGHYANIIKPEYREIGIGVASGIYQGRPVVYVVQHFGVTRDLVIPVASNVELTVKPVFTPITAATVPVVATKPSTQAEQVASLSKQLPVSLNPALVPMAYAGTDTNANKLISKADEANLLISRDVMLAVTALLWLLIGAGLYIEMGDGKQSSGDVSLLAKA